MPGRQAARGGLSMEPRAIVLGGVFVLAGLFLIVAAILRLSNTHYWHTLLGALILLFGLSLIRNPPRRR
jgi:hypothetical protein